MRGAGDRIPRHIADGILTLIDRLPPSGGLCHCDLHPGNVIMTADGPKLVDWIGAVRAHGALDLAVSHFLLSATIRNGHALSMRPCSPSMRGWPARPLRR
jgi:Ser/Thr protein kinase RdoA (MazF antagonist)